METWILILCSTLISMFLIPFLSLHLKAKKLPPGPINIPIISGFLWLRKSFTELEPAIRNLKALYGPIITVQIGSQPSIFISSRSLAHKALVQNGAIFADRPPALATTKIFSSNQHEINSAVYGPTWRLLRRNLTSEILHPSRLKSYNGTRKWVLDILANRLTKSNGVKVIDHFQYAMFSMLVLMCFGDKLDEKQINQIQYLQRPQLLSNGRFNILNFWPSVTKIVWKKWWMEFLQHRKYQEEVLIPLIRARKEVKQNKSEDYVLSYVDTLWDLELPNEKRKLTEDEIISLCTEFMNAGVDTTTTALQWIMANIVKYPTVQERLLAEIKGVLVETKDEEVKEEVLPKMPYLQAVILEGLRRHPPAHLLSPHAVTHDIILDGYMVPKNGTVNFLVADMGWDPEVWENPMDFKPERFLNKEGEEFDITGSKEIKMMPFGAGRRICPGIGLALLNLKYFVANLVWKFEWKGIEDVDLTEKQEFTMVMKNPLKVRISPRVMK
ncbi:cytochrome P450 89A2-like [Argentina anserina]|uniref:cytochrome P450 89A2-like n=1 Tax=Argentina anserina TaxID=57926 RepID=UPI00217654A0|nr:cytochrome P450 89A2-like [Potentilla anserina]